MRLLLALLLALLAAPAGAQSPIPNDPFLSVPGPAPRPRPAPAPTPAQRPTSPAAPAADQPQSSRSALAEGQAALARGNFLTAEDRAREVIARREAAFQVEAQMLLGDALIGRGDFGGAASAYDFAFRIAPAGTRSAEAMLGVAVALHRLGNNRDSCGYLNDLRSRNPNLTGPLAERVADARRRAGCS